MAVVGLKMVTLALVDAKTQQIITGAQGLSETGIVNVDNTMLGTKTANITNLEGSVTKVSGNNQVQDVYVGPGSPQVAFDFNNLDYKVKQKILGRSLVNGGYVKYGSQPQVAVLIETQTLDRRNSVYFGFGAGIFQETAQNIGTDTDTAQTRNDDSLTYTALSTQAFGGEAYKIYYSAHAAFSAAKMWQEVLGGYTETTASNQG
ncbi:phage tail protein [Streptococcus sciuri]|uniref:Phage tail protein n=1 Tax=Streptococcus sciuri TaxID=2973939 RepID=A0ABT2F7L4_9STRE|nr:phage tail protein [Streptococcus sciuri]MCS4488377.1 phage tail protein [Streptococcus sciuri]